MDANISSASCSSSASKFFTGGVGFSRTGSPYLTIGWILRAAESVSGAGACVASELVDLSGIVIEIPPHLGEGVSSKFLQKSIGEHKSNHRFAGNPRSGHDTPIGALVRGLHGLLGDHVCGAKGAAQRGDGFQVAAHDHVFAVGDAAFEAAGAIGRSTEPAGG